MSQPFKYKLSDAVPKPESTAKGGRGGKPKKALKTEAEQVREAHEAAEAKGAESSNRDRMVDIGRGNQQAGRQGGN